MNLPEMNLPDLNFPDRKSWSAAASPSNLAMVALVGFLFVGQATDWKLLFGRKSKAISTVRFGTPELSAGLSGAETHHSRHTRAAVLRDSPMHNSTKADPNSEVADRRSATREAQKSQRELD